MLTPDMQNRLNIIDPTTYPPGTTTLWILAGIAGAAICFTPTWKTHLQLLGTLVHEIGHGLGGLLAGRKFNSLVIHPDASGLTHTTGAGKIGLIICFYSGYTAPGTLAVILAAATASGTTGILLAILTLTLTLTLIRVRNTLTLLTLLTTTLTTFLLFWYPNPTLQTTLTTLLTTFFLTTGTIHVHQAWKDRKNDGGEADADALATLTHIPEPIWLILFYTHMATSALITITLYTLPILHTQ